MLKVLQRNKLYFIFYAVFLFFGAILLLFYSAEELFFKVNAWHAKPADLFFLYITHLGLGGVAAVVLLMLALKQWRYAVTGLIAYLITALITLISKQLIFPDKLRPVKAFEGGDIRLIEGFEPYLHNSFPSGHSSTAFCLFTLMALYFNFKGSSFIWFSLALLVGFSRMYLSVHHFADVYAGSILGVTCSLLAYYFFYGQQGKLKKYNKWLDSSPIKKRT